MSDNKYHFDKNKLAAAHEFCIRMVCNRMSSDVEKIAVHNTFTTEKEIEPYFKLAEQFGYTVFSIIVENRHGGTDKHNVPEETLKKQEQRLRQYIKLR